MVLKDGGKYRSLRHALLSFLICRSRHQIRLRRTGGRRRPLRTMQSIVVRELCAGREPDKWSGGGTVVFCHLFEELSD